MVTSEKREIGIALKQLVEGEPTAFAAVVPESATMFATVVIGFLGLLVRRRFGAASTRPELAIYAKDVHRAHQADGLPPIWVVETALRAAAGETSLLEERQSEELYAATGRLVRRHLRDLNLNDESKASLLLEAESLVQAAFSVGAADNPHPGGQR